MSFQERNVFASLLVGVLFLFLLVRYVHGPLQAGGFSGPEGFAALARQILWLIGISIVANIAVTILFNIGYAIATNTPQPSMVVDERERLIEINGDRYGNYLTGALFIGALFFAALGWSPQWVLLGMCYAFFFGSLLSTVIRLVRHRLAI